MTFLWKPSITRTDQLPYTSLCHSLPTEKIYTWNEKTTFCRLSEMMFMVRTCIFVYHRVEVKCLQLLRNQSSHRNTTHTTSFVREQIFVHAQSRNARTHKKTWPGLPHTHTHICWGHVLYVPHRHLIPRHSIFASAYRRRTQSQQMAF